MLKGYLTVVSYMCKCKPRLCMFQCLIAMKAICRNPSDAASAASNDRGTYLIETSTLSSFP